MRKRLLLTLGMTLIFSAPFAALKAAEFLPVESKDSGNVVVSGDQEHRNLYVGGGSVVINAEILGDLVAGGGSVNVASPVEQDLFAGGGNVSVSSQVGGDARIAGGNLTISAPIGGDALLAGGTVSLSEGATIGGDLWTAGGVVNLTSSVAGDAKIAGGEIFINSEITGELEVWADEKLVFGPGSRVAGPITYTGVREAVIQEGAEVGDIEFNPYVAKDKPPFAAIGLGSLLLFKLLALLIAALIILKLLGRTSLAVVSSAYRSFWSNMGIGIIALIATPIISLLLLITGVGALAGALLLTCFILYAMMAGVFSIMFAGALLEKLVRRQPEMTLAWRMIVWGTLVWAVLYAIPVIGWLVIFGIYLANFGAYLRVSQSKIER